MTTLDTAFASLAGCQLTPGDLLERPHTQGRLRPRVFEALAERLVGEQARQAGLSITTEEVPAAADVFHRGQGLTSAADTHAWLTARGLSVNDFEAGLEAPLLAARLEQHLTAGQVDEHLAAHRAELEQVQPARLPVERDDLAGELASQVRDEGRDLEETAEGLAPAFAEERRPAELDAVTRRALADHLFEGWLAARMMEATLAQPSVGEPG
jgi:hypothetical protein